MERQFWLVKEAAIVLRISPASLRRAVRLGRIPGVRRVPGGRIILIPDSFVEGKAETTPPAAAPITRADEIGESAVVPSHRGRAAGSGG